MHIVLEETIEKARKKLSSLTGVSFVDIQVNGDKNVEVTVLAYHVNTKISFTIKLPKYSEKIRTYATYIFFPTKKDLSRKLDIIYKLYKAKIEAIESGLSTVEKEFLPLSAY